YLFKCRRGYFIYWNLLGYCITHFYHLYNSYNKLEKGINYRVFKITLYLWYMESSWRFCVSRFFSIACILYFTYCRRRNYYGRLRSICNVITKHGGGSFRPYLLNIIA